MLLKSLKLRNIRSYKSQEIPFQPGTTLFEGDIGSGKSTILMATEFALFGLGSEKAGALLRIGADEGEVSLTFDVDGSEYEVRRTLARKGSSIQQKDGYIKTSEGTLPLSSSELKEKVLEILRFNEAPDPKAQSNIYRYAVFTPQEEMKAILFMDPDSRLQILRKAFMIEGYRIARDNAVNLQKDIETDARRLKDISSDLQTREGECEAKLKEITESKKELSQLLNEEEACQAELDDLKRRQESIGDEREKLNKAVGQIPELERQNSDKQTRIIELEKKNKKAQEKIEDYQPKLEELLKAKKPTEKSLKELREEKDGLQSQQDDLTGKKGAIASKIQDYAHIEKKGICPTCDRQADAREFEEKISLKKNEENDIASKIKEIRDKIKETDELMENLRSYNDAQHYIEEYTDKKETDQKSIEENTEKITALKKDIEQNQETLRKAKEELKEYEALTESLRKIKVETEQADSSLKEAGKKVSSKRTKIEEAEKRSKELKEEIEVKKANIKKAEHLTEYKIWLDEYFVPTVQNIEEHVLSTINVEFDQLFQHWFSLLVEDSTKDARIDEKFTPIIEQDKYEQDLKYLSGGEKTSVALSYRLALNTLVRKTSKMTKSNLLILDEPTDGFSKEQLLKIHDILKELQCPQIIMVSHEKELESFADQVYRVAKTDGVSRIS
jgi:DNA repair protein SbcC/Rad50